jgi:hypothetical protein
MTMKKIISLFETQAGIARNAPAKQFILRPTVAGGDWVA